ncbi:MAG: ATP-binding protein [Chitinophagaceae bacterium]|nr:ATP-binding protein [Chitinophagaceae bacterium]
MRNITGPPVVGDDFFGREEEFNYVWSRIVNGNNHVFPSPRRVGKTSFAFKLLDKAKSEGWNTIDINLEKSATNEIDFLEAFVKTLQELSFWEKIKAKGNSLLNFISQLRPSFTIGGAEAKLEWERERESVYSQVADLLHHDEKTLIFFDELTVLLTKILKSDADGKKKVTNFLHWLRSLRQVKDSKIRWIFCSSVGIENFTHQHGISDAINDVPDFFLKSYSKGKSMEMLAKLGHDNNLPLEKDLQSAVVDKLEYCLPYFLQIIFEKIKYLKEIENQPLEIKIVDKAYKGLIEEKHFNTWVERLEEQYNHNKQFAFAVLKQLCQEKKGLKRKQIINAIAAAGVPPEKTDEIVSLLLYMLKNDGYIMEEDGIYRFRSPLLRDFWFNRHVK